MRAHREVVLCAGAVNTPQLLLLSGIGPAAHLRETGVPLLQHIPGVGTHLKVRDGAAAPGAGPGVGTGVRAVVRTAELQSP